MMTAVLIFLALLPILFVCFVHMMELYATVIKKEIKLEEFGKFVFFTVFFSERFIIAKLFDRQTSDVGIQFVVLINNSIITCLVINFVRLTINHHTGCFLQWLTVTCNSVFVIIFYGGFNFYIKSYLFSSRKRS